MRSLKKGICSLLKLFSIVSMISKSCLCCSECLLCLFNVGSFEFVFIFREGLFYFENETIKSVFLLNSFTGFLIFSFMLSSFPYHTFNFSFIKSAATCYRYLLLFAGCPIFRRYVYDTIGINIKSYFYLRNATPCCRNTFESKLSQKLIVLRKLTFTLHYTNIYRRLIIFSGTKYLRLTRRYGGITLNKARCNASHRLNP